MPVAAVLFFCDPQCTPIQCVEGIFDSFARLARGGGSYRLAIFPSSFNSSFQLCVRHDLIPYMTLRTA
jgi:hypothetical protein